MAHMDDTGLDPAPAGFEEEQEERTEDFGPEPDDEGADDDGEEGEEPSGDGPERAAQQERGLDKLRRQLREEREARAQTEQIVEALLTGGDARDTVLRALGIDLAPAKPPGGEPAPTKAFAPPEGASDADIEFFREWVQPFVAQQVEAALGGLKGYDPDVFQALKDRHLARAKDEQSVSALRLRHGRIADEFRQRYGGRAVERGELEAAYREFPQLVGDPVRMVRVYRLDKGGGGAKGSPKNGPTAVPRKASSSRPSSVRTGDVLGELRAAMQAGSGI